MQKRSVFSNIILIHFFLFLFVFGYERNCYHDRNKKLGKYADSEDSVAC